MTDTSVKMRVLELAGGSTRLPYARWNDLLQQACGQYAPDVSIVMPYLDAQAEITLDQFWAAVYGRVGAPAESVTANRKASGWIQSLLVSMGSVGLAAATGQIPAVNAVIPQRWGWVLPVSTMVVQGILAHRNLNWNPNGTPAAVPWRK